MSTWRNQAHRVIAELSRQSYEQANRLPSGKMRAKHVPYSIPEDAKLLIDALGRDDEHEAKSIMMHNYGAQQALKRLRSTGHKKTY